LTGARVRVGQTLSRYFGTRFLLATLAALGGVMALVALIDYVELVRRTADIPHATALMVFQTSIFRVPQVTERIMPFCVLIGAMSCYLSLSRRNELVVARAAGVSAWEFIAPAVIVALGIGILATTIYNPISAAMHERSKRLEAEIFGNAQFFGTYGVSGFWMRQKSFQGSHFANDEQAAGVNRLVMEGKVDPCLSRTFSFAETGECHQLMRDNQHPSGNMAILVNAPRLGLRTLDEVRTAR
jgi:lipopolysaccharide export system permease protein